VKILKNPQEFQHSPYFRNFTKMPCESFMVVSKLLFCHASDDIPNIDEIKTLIKDIFDIRQAKLRTGMDSLLAGNTQPEGSTVINKVSFNNLTLLEINTARPFLPYASDLVARLERVYQQHSSNLNESSHNNSSHFSSSTY
jgi:GINS complex subunit 2